MPMSEIVLIASGDSFERYGKQLQNRLPSPEKLSIVSAYMENAVTYAKTSLPADTVVLIARGNTAKLLKSAHLSVPVVTVSVTDNDLISSIERAKELYGVQDHQIAYIGLEDVLQPVRGFLKRLNMNIRLYRVESIQDIEYSVQRAKREQTQVVIGGISTQKAAEKFGLHSVLLETSLQALQEAYDRALEVQKALLVRERKLQERLILLNATSDCIVGINEKGRISLMNTATQRLFQCSEADFQNKPYKKLFPEIIQVSINRIFHSGKPITGQTVKIQGTDCTVDLYPVQVKEKIQGVMVTIRRGHSPWVIQPFPQTDSNPGLLPGNHPSYKTALSQAMLYAKSELPVCLTGETGAGRQTMARLIHNESSRSEGVFWAQFGQRLSKEDLLSAAGGTLYIRHPESLTEETQIWLTEALTHGYLTAENGSHQNASFRLIVGTETSLQPYLLPELYYLLQTVTIFLPPLRQRETDVWECFLYDWKMFWEEQKQKAPELPNGTRQLLLTWKWPGNLLELKGFCIRLGYLAMQFPLSLELLKECLNDHGEELRKDEENREYAPVEMHQETTAKGFVIRGKLVTYEELLALQRHFQGNKTALAKHLGISRSTLWRYLSTVEQDENL